jgi:arylsulfatase A-like enzyme
MTGDYPHNTGVFTNTAPDGRYDAFLANGDQNKTFPIALQKAGYRTAIMGKFLNGYEPDDPPAPGWTDWVSTGTDGYSEFNYTLRVNSTLEPHGSAPADYLTDVLSDKATSFVQSAVAAKSPFFLEVTTFAPHDPEVPAPRYASAYPGSVLPKTPAFNTLPSDPVAWMSTIQPMDATDLAFVQEKWLARVRSVLAIDDLLGRIRAQLAALGVAGNTYVVFSSDNGFHLGDHRLNYGKQTAFDTDIRVPLIVAGPGVPAGRSNNQMMSSIDLAPTFEDVAGASIPVTVDGVSMLRQWHGLKPAGWQKAILIEHHLRTVGEPIPTRSR